LAGAGRSGSAVLAAGFPATARPGPRNSKLGKMSRATNDTSHASNTSTNLSLGSVRLLMEDLNRCGIRSKVRVAKNGKRWL
jgi:hypothetical protein